MHPNLNNTKNAFTLIELSISMLILGLLISGVLAATKMVSSAKLRKVIKERDQLEQAILDFKVQYGALPGSTKMYEQINDYNEFGSIGNYYNYYNSVYWPNKTSSYFAKGFGNANGMLQMKLSSGGSYPPIQITNANIFDGDTNIATYLQGSSYDSKTFFGFGFIPFGTINFADQYQKYQNLGPAQELVFAGQIYNENTVPSNFSSFLNKHVIILNGNYFNTSTGSWFGRMGQAALSVADSVKLSKKYDTGTPYGQKIFFGFQRPNGGGDVSPDPIIQNQCTTATIFTAGPATNQIGQNTQFLTTGNNVNNASKGCIVVFKTAIDG